MTRAPSAKCGIRTLDDLKGRCIVNDETECWSWQGATHHGEPRIWLKDPDSGKHQTMSAGRAVWVLRFGENPPPRMVVYRHLGCSACCVNPEHRRAATKKRAGAALAASGRLKGDPIRAATNTANARKAAKLTPELAMQIRLDPDDGVTCAAKYGVDVTTISAVRTGKRWRASVQGASVFALASGARAHLRGGE